MALSGRGIHGITGSEDRVIFTLMALRRADVADAAVAMLDVVPVHETAGPGAGGLQILEAPRRKLWAVLGGAEERFGVGVVVADPGPRVGGLDAQPVEHRQHRGGLERRAADAERIARAIRSHWEIENRLHWCLDVQFNEDQSRVRSAYAANNLAIVRHIVMNLLRLNTTRKASIKSKRMLAATIDEFRAELLGVMT
jgi:hypothetical protein